MSKIVFATLAVVLIVACYAQAYKLNFENEESSDLSHNLVKRDWNDQYRRDGDEQRRREEEERRRREEEERRRREQEQRQRQQQQQQNDWRRRP